MLLVRKDRFLSFLDENDLALVWTVNGEKMITEGGDVIFNKRMDISGAYTLDENYSPVGEMSFEMR
jgi:hypothetical protein